MKSLFLLAAASVVIALPASAQETTINYKGTVVATPDPTQAFDLTPGEQVSFSVTYDPSMLLNRTATGVFDDPNTGLPVSIPNIYTVSLADDPNSAFSETLGSHTFTKADDLRFGSDLSLGSGNFPIAIFQGSTFVGVSFEALASDGFITLQDPIGAALGYLPTFGIGGDNNSPNPTPGFLITADLPVVQLGAAPEPATWAMMLVGFGTIGFGMRYRRWDHLAAEEYLSIR